VPPPTSKNNLHRSDLVPGTVRRGIHRVSEQLCGFAGSMKHHDTVWSLSCVRSALPAFVEWWRVYQVSVGVGILPAGPQVPWWTPLWDAVVLGSLVCSVCVMYGAYVMCCSCNVHVVWHGPRVLMCGVYAMSGSCNVQVVWRSPHVPRYGSPQSNLQ